MAFLLSETLSLAGWPHHQSRTQHVHEIATKNL